MDDDCRARVREEVEALGAIYGEDGVSYDASTGALCVQIRVGCALSMLLPGSYPADARPGGVTLRADGVARARAAELVADALRTVHADRAGFGECVFDYCQAVLAQCDEEDLAAAPAPAPSPAAGSAGDTHNADAALWPGSRVVHGEPLIDRKSVFQAHAARVSTVHHARAFTAYLLAEFPKLAAAAHHIMAYRIGSAQDFDDDGEHGAGKGVLFTLQQLDVDDVVVVVSRFFGGVKLGPVRFKHINNVARQLLVEHFTRETVP